MLNSAEHEILNFHKNRNNKKFSFFSGSDKPIMLVFLLINVKMPTVVGILTFLSRKKFHALAAEFSMKIFYNLGASFYLNTAKVTKRKT